MAARALLLDFNGTLSDDEPILCAIFQDLFAAEGKPLTAAEYYERLAGLSDPELVRAWLGEGHPALQHVVERKIERYRDLVADGSTVAPYVREAVRLAGDRGLVAVVSGSARREIEAVLAGAALENAFDAVVAAEDVERGKPDPEGYLRALALLGREADDAVAVEDSEAGIAAAKAAGVRCVALPGTLPRERLAAADELAQRLDAALVRRLLS